MPMTIAEVNQVLDGHDLVIVIGAQVFRYYPYVAGEYLPEGTELIQLTVDPHLASVAPVGDSLLGDVRVALEQLVDLIDAPAGRPAPTPLESGPRRAVLGAVGAADGRRGLRDLEHRQARRLGGGDGVHVDDGRTAAVAAHHAVGQLLRHRKRWHRLGRPGSRGRCARRPRAGSRSGHIVATIGDGSFQYSIQAIWTAAQHKLPIVFVVLRNGAYAILKSFALLEKTPDVPALDLPGLDIASLATGFGCRTANVEHHRRARAASSRRRCRPTGPPSSWSRPKPELPHLG